MMVDFDQVIDRRGGDSSKWNRAGETVLPMPVADMDFQSPPAVIQALRRRADHGVFGYADPPASVVEAITTTLANDYAWEIDPDWLVWLPGLVTGLNLACRMPLERQRNAVVTSVPIYPPFLSAPEWAGRSVIRVPLTPEDGRYRFPPGGLERACADSDAGVFLNCNPHNPTGRVFSRPELERIASVCLSNGLLLVSDEIHSGLVLDEDKRHVPMATLDPDVAERTITLMSPSKTYNLAGLTWAYAVIPNPGIRRAFLQTAKGLVTDLNVFGYAACEAAYRHGGGWLRDLLAVLRRNRDRVRETVEAMDGLRMPHVEATYLAWIDCRQRRFEESSPAVRFERFGLGLSDGAYFGAPGFARLNFACPLPTLLEGLRRFANALEGVPLRDVQQAPDSETSRPSG